ncbi:hypothetical protein [Methylocapsa aurea]|uniref:hypothetical protein n=1 Tax=Methylocapsa aurea TaxID=663610 RepID=UPI000AB48333|nr:hypothetical protein [Methylocapsa aurea]
MAREYTISDRALVALVTQLTGGYPNPDDTSPPGPWGPVIRQALERLRRASGPVPDPWLEVALNPQPLPPKAAFATAFAQQIVDRVLVLQDVADAMPRQGEQQGIIIVSGYISRFVDDYCGTGFRFKWPFPGPRPNWFTEEVNGADLILAGVQFERAAAEISNEELTRSLIDGAARLKETGLARLQ